MASGSYWQALGQLGGSALQYEANSQESRRLRELEGFKGDANHQIGKWTDADNAQLQAYLRNLTSQRYLSQQHLAQEMASPDRLAAGDQAGADSNARLMQAFGLVNTQPVGNRALVGERRGGGFDQWRSNTAARFQPVLQARANLINQSNSQRGMSRYDTTALNRAADTSIDLNRQGVDAQRQSSLLEAYRRMLSARAGVQYKDNGPGSSFRNLNLAAGVLGAAGGAADSYNASREPSMTQQQLGYDPDREDRGSRVVGYSIYNPNG
jgi:hypothetical protein